MSMAMAGILTFGSNRRLPRNAPSDIIWSVGNNADYSSGTVQDLHLIPFLITPLVNLLRFFSGVSSHIYNNVYHICFFASPLLFLFAKLSKLIILAK